MTVETQERDQDKNEFDAPGDSQAAGETPESPESGQSADDLPEISPTLEQYLNDQEEKPSDAADTGTSDEKKGATATVETKAERLDKAENAVIGVAFTVGQVAGHFGLDLGITEESATALAKGVAPCMVKYDLLPSANGGKYKEEIKALSAIFVFGVGVATAVRRQRLGNDQAQQENQQQEGQQAHGHQS